MDANGKATVLYTTTDTSPQSGAFNSLLYMSREIKNWGYRSLLVLPEGNGESRFANGKTVTADYRLPLPQAKLGKPVSYYLDYIRQNSRSIIALAGILRKEKVAIIHANEILDLYAGVAARLAGVPCVWHIRSDLSTLPMVRSILPRVALGLSSSVIVVSDSVSHHMFQTQHIHSRKVSVIHNPGPNLSVFHPQVDGSAVRAEFGIGPHDQLVVLVAKLGERKGHDIAIQAAPSVLASYPNALFLLVGGDLEGRHHAEYAAQIRAMPRALGVEDKVIFTGYRSDVPQIMAAADVVLHCSTYPDPFPGVVLQGMAVGRAVIAPDLGGPREQIEHQVSGLLIEPASPAALAEAICNLLGDEDKRDCLGQAAAARVQATFTPDLFFQKLSGVYESLITHN